MIQLKKIQAASAPFYPYGEAVVCLDCGATFPLLLKDCPACGSRANWNPARWTGKLEEE